MLVPFQVQDGIDVFRNSHNWPAPFLRSFHNVAFEAVPLPHWTIGVNQILHQLVSTLDNWGQSNFALTSMFKQSDL